MINEETHVKIYPCDFGGPIPAHSMTVNTTKTAITAPIFTATATNANTTTITITTCQARIKEMNNCCLITALR